MERDSMRAEKRKQRSKQQPEAPMPNPNKEYGEGNYKATREYNDATAEFVKSGRVDDAARNAEPRSPEERNEMRKAERTGSAKSKGEDPQLYKRSHKSSDTQ
jgi:hypothetical protein